ncbi:baseplate J/gp47 family protein [Paenibacillus sp. SI8]|uniref:baseplate J/gp47 family protein n=1 Tax=unclassified Paenibacillus TaxID=185978 RepID=UPI0034659446
MALDSAGFKRKRFDDLFSEMEMKAKDVFGQNINTSERSVMGILLRLFAWFLAKAWQNSEDVYNSAYVNTAVGANLDRLGPYGGITRIQATQASGMLLITGVAGMTIQAGYRAAAGNIVFETIEAVTLSNAGTGTTGIRAVIPGRSGNLVMGTITTIVNPLAYVSSVINSTETAGGREKETDKEFRDRFALSSEGRGKATVGSVRSALLSVPGVRAATVVENYTSAVVNGRPAKCLQAYVLGGNNADIGQAIFDTKAGGIEPFGSEAVTVKDDAGFEHTMYFSRADEVTTHLRFTVKVNTSYPSDGDAQLITAAIRYIGGEDADGTLYVGLNMGADVVYSRLYALSYAVEGVEDVVPEISRDGVVWTQVNLSISPNEVAQTTYSTVKVVHAA